MNNESEEVLSNCCGAQIIYEGFCGRCKEHCIGSKECPECNGTGLVYDITCATCKGDGYTEVDL
jgi:hypothetical protein